MKIGYFLSSEEWGPRDLVELAVKAEQAGVDAVFVQQIGPDQDAFFEAYREHVLPRF